MVTVQHPTPLVPHGRFSALGRKLGKSPMQHFGRPWPMPFSPVSAHRRFVVFFIWANFRVKHCHPAKITTGRSSLIYARPLCQHIFTLFVVKQKSWQSRRTTLMRIKVLCSTASPPCHSFLQTIRPDADHVLSKSSSQVAPKRDQETKNPAISFAEGGKLSTWLLQDVQSPCK